MTLDAPIDRSPTRFYAATVTRAPLTLTVFLENMMIQFAKDLIDKDAQRGNDASKNDALIELND